MTKSIPIQDRLEIQELSTSYAFFCDTKDYRSVSQFFIETGVWDESVLGLPVCEGRMRIHEFFCGMEQANLDYLIHINGSHRIAEFDNDAASGTVHLHSEGRINGNDFRILGYYADDYVKREGAWFFKKRKLIEIAPTQGSVRSVFNIS